MEQWCGPQRGCAELHFAAKLRPYFPVTLGIRIWGWGELVLRQWRVPGLLLLVVSATTALSESTGVVRAVEECRLEPGLPAPSGSMWLYRVNRDHRRCWFLSSRAIGGHHTQLRRAAPVRNRFFAGDTDAVRLDQKRDGDLQTASTAKNEVAVAAEPPAVPQAAAPLVEQSRKI